MKKTIIVFLISSLAYAVQAAEDKPENTLGLSDSVSVLLKAEMNEIKKGMESLVFAMASGNWKQIQETGHRIKHSYIMKNKLTESQKHELHAKLPAQFREIDKKFHYYAGMLSHVAEERDIELVNFYFAKMNETCMSCHSKFVTNRFEGFRQGNKHEQHDH